MPADEINPPVQLTHRVTEGNDKVMKITFDVEDGQWLIRVDGRLVGSGTSEEAAKAIVRLMSL